VTRNPSSTRTFARSFLVTSIASGALGLAGCADGGGGGPTPGPEAPDPVFVTISGASVEEVAGSVAAPAAAGGGSFAAVEASRNRPGAAVDVVLFDGELRTADVSGGKGAPVAFGDVLAVDVTPPAGALQPVLPLESVVLAPETGYAPLGRPVAGRVYAVAFADGTYAKLYVRSYEEKEAGPTTHRTLVLDWVYRCDGSRRLAPNYAPVDPGTVVVGDGERAGVDIALVADNSGSETGFLKDVQSALHRFLSLLDPALDGASLVRVSTRSLVRVPLTQDLGAVGTGVDALFVANGFTALYDGVRLGNESLALGPSAADARRDRAVVAFTDGKENSSADENPTTVVGDGVDTTLDDLGRLEVAGVRTPVYTVAIGEADPDELEAMAARSGGRAYTAATPAALAEIYATIADSVGTYTEVSWSTTFGDRGAVEARTALVQARAKVKGRTRTVTAYVRLGRDGERSRCSAPGVTLPSFSAPSGGAAVGDGPAALALSGDGRRVYVANRNDGTVSVLDVSGPSPVEVDMDLDPRTTSPNAPAGVTRLRVGRQPSAVAVGTVASGQERLFVASAADGTVVAYRTSDLAEVGRATVGGEPVALAFAHAPGAPGAGFRVYAALFADDVVVALDGSTLEVAGVFGVAGTPNAGDRLRDKPTALAVSSDGARVFSTHARFERTEPGVNPGRLMVLDATKLGSGAALPRAQVALADVETGGNVPVAVALNPAGTRAYVAHRESGSVSVLNVVPATPVVLGTAAAGAKPSALAVSADGARVLAALSGAGVVAVLDGTTLAPLGALPGGHQPVAVAAGGASSLFVAAFGDDEVRTVVEP